VSEQLALALDGPTTHRGHSRVWRVLRGGAPVILAGEPLEVRFWPRVPGQDGWIEALDWLLEEPSLAGCTLELVE